jgi:protein-disulfide isomerase
MNASRWGLWGGLILAILCGGLSSAAETGQSSSLEERLNGMEKDIKEIKELLKALTAPSSQFSRQSPSSPEVTVSFDHAPIKGDPKATLILIEFSDYQCPFCGKFFHTTLPEIDRAYIQAGKLRHVLRDYPLPMHAHAAKAAEAADCAGEQGKYWEMHDLLFSHQQALGLDQLTGYAKELKLDEKFFETCLTTGKFKEKIARDIADGQRVGVSGTPSFILGVTTDGKTIKGSVITGTKPFPFFKDLMESMLAQPTAK